ncbi:CD166 antigen homolog [Lates japonicus]|uniref:CD166 antigen homolog n=1 Tax=Lates japonicus TaxID=270547 RepID=A0AAD3M489_LATJO|nr:CD166 antigen homolog [Lates japonicus]
MAEGNVWGTESVTAMYGETIVIPCSDGSLAAKDLMFIKWKYEKDDGTPGDLLIKQARNDQATIQATDDYAQRVSIDDEFSLLITQASLKDQKTFTCMVVSVNNLMEYPVSVVVHKKPSSVQIMDKSEVLQRDKLTTVGTCVATDANPAATITWKKNGRPLLSDGKAVVINPSLKLDPATGLSTTSSTLQYAATKDDVSAVFACIATHESTNQETDLEPFPIHYLDLSLSPTGKIVKTVGDTLSVKVEKSTSGDAKVSWTKNGMAMKEPEFSKLTYADAGIYLCEVSTTSLTRHQSFELVVEGKPVITSLTKHRADDAKHKVLTCEAEGVPEPSFQWSINSTTEESSYINGKATHKITVIPKVNLTVSCRVSNRLGEDVMTINVSSIFEEGEGNKGSPVDSEDQAKLVVGVVAGLLIAAAAVGLIYWLYMKNSRQGSWKTGEKEVGTSEESKKLENNHTV